ncbi:ROK family protein [Saccharothrix sp. 6-C]|uniref:Putative NBD/HSP70 family sugar kinase n=1 Tax=Saccharothrix texasensis TaxID=103734 RepID=A0A3N1H316_9PSEU|nr:MULTISPECIES: ROK family transcriptional regulator [Saccharothrix]QQQ78404.1 ROK family protein [Saccharothrix sp. 6-C]ROP36933.1 putative NBD/HSP70 family sugar kinase [Saccharothrix texasensis]
MAPKRTTVRDLRRQNRSTLLSTLFFDGPLSRFELSRLSGLSAATVSNVTGELVDDGLVVEAGSVDSDGGRPRVLLRVNPAFAHVVGVDVGETGIKVELFDLALTQVAALDHALSPSSPAAVASLIASSVRDVVAAAGVPASTVLGVGIGVPGTVEQGPTAVVHAPTIGWDGVRLEELVAAASESAWPLYVENGAKTQGQAEMWFGAGQGAKHVVIALIGSGVGAAVVTDGGVYRGATSSAGEWGHTTIVYGGRPCRCGALGCLEAYVGAEGILDRYRKARGRELPDGDEQSTVAALIDAASRSKTAARVLDETAGYLGAGIANLVNLFNPERIVLGGWAGLALGSHQLDRIVAATRAHALRHPYEQISIELGRLGPDAVAVGAATLPVAALLDRAADPRKPAAPDLAVDFGLPDRRTRAF